MKEICFPLLPVLSNILPSRSENNLSKGLYTDGGGFIWYIKNLVLKLSQIYVGTMYDVGTMHCTETAQAVLVHFTFIAC